MPNDRVKQVEKPVELVEVSLIVKDLRHILDKNGNPLYKDVPGKDIRDFEGLPIYRFISPNILRRSAAVMRDSHDIFVYDVTNAPEDLKKKYEPFIVKTDCDVEKSHGVESEKARISCGRIVELLPLDGSYATLRPFEKRRLGNEFVALRNLDDGSIELVVVDIASEIPDNVYLKVNLAKAGERLRGKLSSEVVEVISKGNGQFALPGQLEKEKTY